MTNNLSPEQERIFLNAYFERDPKQQEWQQLNTAKRKYYLVVASIWFRFAEVPGEQTALIDQKLESSTLKSAREHLKEGSVVNIRTAPKEEILQYALSFYRAYLDSQ